MTNWRKNLLLFVVFITALPCVLATQPLLDPTSAGFGGETRSENYETLLDALYAGKATTVIGGERLWVPWFRRSDSCGVSDLQSGSNCDSGSAIDATHNCMVTDEFSQVGILVAMGDDQARMDQFFKTVEATASTNGGIPAWRVYRDGDTIEPCRPGINGNCDTASDATARIIIALYTAAKNPAFSSTAQATYLAKAQTLSSAMLQYEVDQTCRPSSLGDGEICYWLAAGSDAKRGGIASTDYAYTGYYADAIIAMLQAYAATGEQRYKEAAEDFGLNYLEAAKFNGHDFTVPPGRSYKWVAGADGVLSASCTASCSPTQWEDADAPRAFGLCQANYYAKQMDIALTGMQAYCDAWETAYGRDPASIPTQYNPDGSAAVASQSGYFAQGLQALFEPGCSHSSDYASIMDNALRHYSPSTGTWDNAACFGVYHAAFAIRALGMGLGRDLAAFTVTTSPLPTIPPLEMITPPATAPTTPPTGSLAGIGSLQPSCTANGAACALKSDVTSGVCRTNIWGTSAGEIRTLACEKENGYIELYRQTAPEGISFNACLADGCVNQDRGFERYNPTNTQTITQPAPVNTPPTTAPAAAPTGIEGLAFSVTPSGTRISDESDGSCRTVRFATPSGEIQAKACAKDSDRYELYLLQAANPSSICIAGTNGDANCVGPATGFASFTG